LGAQLGDGGKWVREQCAMLAQNGNGSMLEFLDEPLIDLMDWIAANNAAVAKHEEGK
jgi:hypothetical protein